MGGGNIKVFSTFNALFKTTKQFLPASFASNTEVDLTQIGKCIPGLNLKADLILWHL
jgi:hypothetical protein